MMRHCFDFWRLSNPGPIDRMLSGTQVGADKLGEELARSIGIEPDEYPPDYDRHPPKQAPVIRNTQMAVAATHLIAFWDGASRGTWDMIQKAYARKLKTDVFSY